MKLTIICFFLTLLFCHCTNDQIQSLDLLTIRTGTSFGMCVGYCRNDYTVNGPSLKLAQTQPGLQPLVKTCETTITQADWDSLKALANIDTFGKQPGTIGCPDCADGGAEYVELQKGDQRHRVVFEYNKTIPGFEGLVERLRTHRNSLKACN